MTIEVPGLRNAANFGRYAGEESVDDTSAERSNVRDVQSCANTVTCRTPVRSIRCDQVRSYRRCGTLAPKFEAVIPGRAGSGRARITDRRLPRRLSSTRRGIPVRDTSPRTLVLIVDSGERGGGRGGDNDDNRGWVVVRG